MAVLRHISRGALGTVRVSSRLSGVVELRHISRDALGTVRVSSRLRSSKLVTYSCSLVFPPPVHVLQIRECSVRFLI